MPQQGVSDSEPQRKIPDYVHDFQSVEVGEWNEINCINLKGDDLVKLKVIHFMNIIIF